MQGIEEPFTLAEARAAREAFVVGAGRALMINAGLCLVAALLFVVLTRIPSAAASDGIALWCAMKRARCSPRRAVITMGQTLWACPLARRCAGC